MINMRTFNGQLLEARAAFALLTYPPKEEF
jgi:hypothetical protein